MTDEGFIGRVYRTCAYVWAFGALIAWSYGGLHTAFGWTFGSAISVGLLYGIERVVRKAVRPGNIGAKKYLAYVAALHWPIIVGIMALAVWLSGRRIAYLIAFIAGLGLTQVVIVLKAVGAVLVERMNER
jgi:hypothetical protein